MSIGKGIAIGAIWGAVAASAFASPFLAFFLGLFALAATEEVVRKGGDNKHVCGGKKSSEIDSSSRIELNEGKSCSRCSHCNDCNGEHHNL